MPESTPIQNDDVKLEAALAPIINKQGAEKLAFVDAMRGIAILLVMMVHSAISVPGINHSTRILLEEGLRGVQLFFIASAFTLFLSMKNRAGRERYATRNFFIRRFFRIAPMFYLGMGYYLLLKGLSPGENAPLGISASYIFCTALFLHGWHPYMFNSVVPGGWSIAVEMNFYLLLPLMYKYIKDLTTAVSAFIGSVLISYLIPLVIFDMYPSCKPGLTWFLSWNCLPAQLPIFLTGIILFYIYEKYIVTVKMTIKKEAAYKQTGAGLSVLALTLFIGFSGFQHAYLSNSLLYGFVFLILAVGLALNPIRLLVNSPMRYLGAVSFSAYLVHFTILDLLKIANERLLAELRIPAMLDYILIMCSLVLLTALVSTVTYRFIEIPFQNVGRNIIRRLEQCV